MRMSFIMAKHRLNELESKLDPFTEFSYDSNSILAEFSVIYHRDFSIRIIAEPADQFAFVTSFLMEYTYHDTIYYGYNMMPIHRCDVKDSQKFVDNIVLFFKSVTKILPLVLTYFKVQDNISVPYENHTGKDYEFMSLIESLTFPDELSSFIVDYDIEEKMRHIIETKFCDLNAFLDYNELREFVSSDEDTAMKLLTECAARHGCVISDQMRKDIIVSSIV